MQNVQDKVVIVTGASSGIGEACARLLSSAGAKLMLGARREDKLRSLVGELGANAAYRVTDVARRSDVEALAQAALERFGRIDVLINNAGVMPLSRLDALKVDEWERMVDVNIKGVLYGIAAVLPTMQAQQSGHIINLASVAGHVVFPSGAVYCASKHAVRALSEGLRQESGPNIRTTIISPGRIVTELTAGISDPVVAKAMNEAYKVAIHPDAIARAVAYAIDQPADVDVNEILLRPTAQDR